MLTGSSVSDTAAAATVILPHLRAPDAASGDRASCFAFDDVRLTAQQIASSIAPAASFVVTCTRAMRAPCVLPLFGMARPVAFDGEIQHTSTHFTSRFATRATHLIDCSLDVAPQAVRPPNRCPLPSVDGVPSLLPVVGCAGLALAPFLREPALAQTLCCAGYVDDAGDNWFQTPLFGGLVAFMTAHWARLQPMLGVERIEEYPLAVVRVVNDVPAGGELLVMFNGFDLVGRRQVCAAPARAWRCEEGAMLLRQSPTSLRDLNLLLAAQSDDVQRDAYVATLTAVDAKDTARMQKLKQALQRCSAALCAKADADADADADANCWTQLPPLAAITTSLPVTLTHFGASAGVGDSVGTAAAAATSAAAKTRISVVETPPPPPPPPADVRASKASRGLKRQRVTAADVTVIASCLQEAPRGTKRPRVPMAAVAAASCSAEVPVDDAIFKGHPEVSLDFICDVPAPPADADADAAETLMLSTPELQKLYTAAFWSPSLL